jgi:hypothetical protein
MWILGTSYDVASGGERFLVLLPTDDVKVDGAHCSAELAARTAPLIERCPEFGSAFRLTD